MPTRDKLCGCGKLIYRTNTRCMACDNAFRKTRYLGEANPFFGKKHSDETKAKMRANHKHTKVFLGQHHTEETKQKIRDKNTGSHLTQEQRDKISVFFKGRIFSDEHRLNLSIAGKNREPYPSNLKHTDEFKRNLSERNKKNWRDPEYVKHITTLFWNTKPEREMALILNELNIAYTRHKRIAEITHPILVDFYLPDFHCVIETDGKYWHNYPFGNDIDHIRTKEMLDAGYEVLRFWENEFDRESVNDRIKILRPLIRCVVGE